MKLFTLLFSILAVAGYAQNSKNIVAKIDHVTVFVNQAQIESSFNTTLATGISKIYIDDIANTVDPNSIQVGGKGDFMLMGVKYSANHLNKKSSAILDSIKMVTNEIDQLQMLLGVAQNQEKMIMANANVKSEQNGLAAENFKTMIELFKVKLTEVGSQILKLKKQLEPLTLRKTNLELQYAESQNVNLPLGQIELTVSTTKGTSAAISLSYVANNAGWTPNYDLRVKDTKSPVNIIYKAAVYQNTGIDWKNVKLTLSTSNPIISGQKPELQPKYLSFYQEPRYYKSARVQNEMAAAPAPAMMADMSSISSTNIVIETAVAINFEIGALYSLNSGGTPEQVEVQNYTAAASYNYMIIPKLNTSAFLTAEIQDWEKLKLLSGECNIYFEDKFVGKSYINEQNVDNKLTLSLGRDTRIFAKREEIDNYKSKKIFGSNTKQAFGFKTTIKNTKNEKATIILEDQVPISQNSEISVEIDDTNGATADEKTGKLKYEFVLEPNQSKEIQVKYTVKYPKDQRINNL